MHSANEAAAKLGFLAKQHSRQFLIYYFLFSLATFYFSFRLFSMAAAAAAVNYKLF